MPIIDYDDELSYDSTNKTSKQSIVGNAGTAIVLGGVKDAGAARDWGAGEVLTPYARTVDALTGATGGVQVDIVAADNAALSTNPVVLSTITIAEAAFLANKLFAMPPLVAGQKKRYLGVKATPLTTNSTAGSLIVGFMPRDGRPQDGVNFL